MPKNDCPDCEELKDTRAKRCLACSRLVKPNRKGRRPAKELKSKYRHVGTKDGTRYEHRLVMEEFLGR